MFHPSSLWPHVQTTNQQNNKKKKVIYTLKKLNLCIQTAKTNIKYESEDKKISFQMSILTPHVTKSLFLLLCVNQNQSECLFSFTASLIPEATSELFQRLSFSSGDTFTGCSL